ncbi:hypothetical protein IKF40_02410 [Candidatus Saccharibacteria bacterium]|nr:hypothetical protein [Candidatus Saccharibacteria bacterium]
MELIPVISLVLIGYSFLSGILAVVGAGKGNKFKALGFFLVISVIIALTIIYWWEYSYLLYLAAAVIALVVYIQTLKHRWFDMRNLTIKIWNYLTLAAGAVVVYVVLFYVIAKYLFHIQASAEIIAINMIMIIIVVILLPIVNELNTMINSRVMTGRVDLTYVIKRLNRLATQDANPKKLAEFLAKYLHFKVVGIIVDDKFYSSSKKLRLTSEEITQIALLENSGKDIWQKIEGKAKETLEKYDLKAVAEMRNAKGRPFGQIVIGKPLGKVDFEKRDLNEISMIVNLVASIVDSQERLEV